MQFFLPKLHLSVFRQLNHFLKNLCERLARGLADLCISKYFTQFMELLNIVHCSKMINETKELSCWNMQHDVLKAAFSVGFVIYF